jgi:hypothetical protein
VVGDELAAARPGQFTGVVLAGGRHIDGSQSGNVLLQSVMYLLAGASQPRNVAAVTTLASGWIDDMFDGTRDGSYGAPRQVLQIPTTAGTATATVLPFTSEDRIQATPFDGLLGVVLDAIGTVAVYRPLTAPQLSAV